MKISRFKILVLGSLFAIVVFGSFIPFKSFAQSISSYLGDVGQTNSDSTILQSTTIFMHLSPENPKPGDTVTINLTSFSENLDTSSINWYANSKSIVSGIGKKSVVIQAPNAGSSILVSAIIKTPEGSRSSVSTTISPAGVVLLWEAVAAYTPPFYRGKSLTTPGNWIKVVAMPEIKTSSGMAKSNSLVYSWEQNFTNSEDGSGFANDSFIYKNDYLDNSDTVGVTVSTTDQKYTSEDRINIVPQNSAKIIFYREDPNLGINWDNALQNQHKINGDEIVVAAPYFVSPSNLQSSDLVFKWTINNIPTSILSPLKNVIPLKAESNVSGSSSLGLQITSKTNFLESISNVLTIQF